MVVFGLRCVWMEDRFLTLNLPRFREYAARVRYGLVSGIWYRMSVVEEPHRRAPFRRVERQDISSSRPERFHEYCQVASFAVPHLPIWWTRGHVVIASQDDLAVRHG
jgi:hypothetical protein